MIPTAAEASPWGAQIQAVAQRYDQEFAGQPFDLPREVEEMPIFKDWIGGTLTPRIATPFWEALKPRKGERCLDIGCGISFLIYPWREWDALFHGHEISRVACQALTSRGPQLNSKLFKGIKPAPAHRLDYEANRFDLAIATGVSCYYPADYWDAVLQQVKRVLKPGGHFLFDAINPESEIAESWAILETYLGAEVFLDSLAQWPALVKASGGRVVSHRDYDLFRLYKVKWEG
ncbi:MAG TPA: methyltransferase domain-containing protein [Leptolyngbyaceae cyanobacterium M65_K2018_010]|nr:methyltransferase domain-containing protein [Leptolyngbyaceae cyanobacterium M65_K2018_010]